jgi:hypothetical protein
MSIVPSSGTTLRQDLGTIAYAYILTASQKGFIGLELMPLFPTKLQSSYYPKFSLKQLLTLPETKVNIDGTYNRVGAEFDSATYSCIENGIEAPLSDKNAKLYQTYFDAEKFAIMRATDIILRNQEKRIVSILQGSGITNTSAVSTEWSTITATPRTDVMAAVESLRAASGLVADAIAISWKVFYNLLKVTEVKDANRYGTTTLENASLDEQKAMIARHLTLKKVFVGNAIYNSANIGQTAIIADIWDDEYATLFKMSETNGTDLEEPVVGRTFLWTEDSPSNIVTEVYREDKTRSSIYRVRHDTDERIVHEGAAYRLSNITA